MAPCFRTELYADKPSQWRWEVQSSALCLILTGSPAYAGEIVVANYEGVINPVAAEYLHDALALAHSSGAQALIFKLDTPGGLDTSMRLMIKDMTGSPIPVIVFVAPSGGRAASAGVFITMAAHVAAMAPGTNIGAAHPVAMGGGEMDNTMKEKVENDAAAYIKSIAEQRGRNVSWAEDAVRKSISATEQEALKLKIIDLVAEDIPALLKQLNGRKIVLPNGVNHVLKRGRNAPRIPDGNSSGIAQDVERPQHRLSADVHRNHWDYGRTLQPRRHPARYHRRHQLDPGFLFAPVAPRELCRRPPCDTRRRVSLARNFRDQLWITRTRWIGCHDFGRSLPHQE